MHSNKPRMLKHAVTVAFFILTATYAVPLAQTAQIKNPLGPTEKNLALQSAVSQQPTASGPSITLAELERMALQANPTLAQAEAAINAAEGRRRQAGLFPNPIIGYRGEELAFRAFSDKSEHFFFFEQNIPTGGRLKKSQRIFEQEKAASGADAEAQRLRVLNTVRMLYYGALGAQQLVELRTELARIAGEAVKTTGELFNIGQADRPDYFESEIEAQRAELDLVSAENEFRRAWQLLASVVGSPEMKPLRVAGDLEKGVPEFDQATVLATLLQQSPELKIARANVDRARAIINRAKAEVTPELFIRGGFGYSTEFLESRFGATARRTGPEASVEIGLRVPLFNRNQGNIAAAQAELVSAEKEVHRVELVLRVRLASAFTSYENSRRLVERYQQAVLPRAQNAYDLYLASFRQMAAAYPQVLIAQRTMFQVRADYVHALINLWENGVQIQGYLLTGGLDAPAGASSRGDVQMSAGADTGPGARNQQ